MLPPWIDWTSFRLLFLSIVCCTDTVLVFIVVYVCSVLCCVWAPWQRSPPLWVRESRLVLLTFLVDWSLLLMDSCIVRGVAVPLLFFSTVLGVRLHCRLPLTCVSNGGTCSTEAFWKQVDAGFPTSMECV